MNTLFQPQDYLYRQFWPQNDPSLNRFANSVIVGAPLGAIGAGGYMLMSHPKWPSSIPGGVYTAGAVGLPMAVYGGSVFAPAVYTAWNYRRLQEEKKNQRGPVM